PHGAAPSHMPLHTSSQPRCRAIRTVDHLTNSPAFIILLAEERRLGTTSLNVFSRYLTFRSNLSSCRFRLMNIRQRHAGRAIPCWIAARPNKLLTFYFPTGSRPFSKRLTAAHRLMRLPPTVPGDDQ